MGRGRALCRKLILLWEGTTKIAQCDHYHLDLVVAVLAVCRAEGHLQVENLNYQEECKEEDLSF